VIIAGILVVLGILLAMFVHKALLAVSALGIFGPGILRELGWLRDHDEFQRQAAWRAGYHAYLAGGLVAVVLLGLLEFFEGTAVGASELVLLVVVVLWMTWLFSAVIAYWGAPRTASTILIVFGSFWVLFSIASFMEGFGPDLGVRTIVLLLSGIVALAAAFFVPAWTAHRWPQVTGVALLVIAVALGWFFLNRGRGGLEWSTRVLTAILLLGPFVLPAIGLLLHGSEDGRDDSEAPDGAVST
jgi:hypothetical protein